MGDDLAIEYVEAIAEFGRRGVERRSGGDSDGEHDEYVWDCTSQNEHSLYF